MIIGYARVSTKDQNLQMQIDALKNANCEEIYSEKASGKKVDRGELERVLTQLRTGDVLVVYSLDRLGRTAKQLIELLNEFKERRIHFKSLTEGYFDTSTPMGEAIFQIIAILKAMEVNVLRERTRDGLRAARARGKNGGRPVGSYDKIKAAAAVSLYSKKGTISNITKVLNISRSTLYQYLQKEGVDYKSK